MTTTQRRAADLEAGDTVLAEDGSDDFEVRNAVVAQGRVQVIDVTGEVRNYDNDDPLSVRPR